MRNILFTVILTFAFSCNEILEENPKAVAIETFYNTAEEIEGAVYAAYSPFRAALGSNPSIWLVNGGQVDYAYGRLSFANMSDFQAFSSTNISRVTEIWANFYQGIRNANLVIKNAPNASKATSEEINKYIAEAKFLRGLSYFYMVRNWGALPLRTEENMLEPDVPRSPISDVYTLITSDIEYAEANLPSTQPNAGRADQFAAKAILSHVYLQLERWSDARSKALEVINSGRYSLVEVKTSDDFYKIFGPEINKSSEEVFYAKFNYTSASYTARYRHHPSFPQYFNSTGVFAKYADNVKTKVIKEWDNNDLRKTFNLYNANIGFGTTTVLFKKFIDPDAPSSGGKNDFPAYRYPDILLFYAEADCRANNGPTPDGMEKLNMIHRRAYGYSPNAASPVDFNVNNYNTNTFIDLILQEGMYEQMDHI